MIDPENKKNWLLLKRNFDLSLHKYYHYKIVMTEFYFQLKPKKDITFF
jgi:hypothetical protein